MLDYGRKLVALRDLHADAADIDIADSELAAAIDQIPVDLDRAAARPDDLAADHCLLAARAGSGHLERLAAVLGKPGGIGLHDVVLEQLQKCLLLLRRRGAPIAAEHELADPGDIEIVLEELAEPRQTLRRGDTRPEHLDRLGAE